MEPPSPGLRSHAKVGFAPTWRKATVHTSANVTAAINKDLPQRAPAVIKPKTPTWQTAGENVQGAHHLMNIKDGEWKPFSYGDAIRPETPKKPPVFGVAKRAKSFVPRVTRASVAHAVAHNVARSQRCVRNYWVLSALVLFALLGVALALILFLMPCDPIYVPVTKQVNTTVNRTVTELVSEVRNVTKMQAVNITRNVTTNRTVNATLNVTRNVTENVTRNVTRQVVVNTTNTEISVAPFDGMLLLDASGSIADPTVCTTSCKYDQELELGMLVGEALYNGTIGKGGDHFQVGSITWNYVLVDVMPPTALYTQWQDQMTSWMGQTHDGGTYFGPPLARCAQEVKHGTGVNNDPDVFKMCMLVSDGINYDYESSGRTCTTADCQQVCDPFGYSGRCNAETIAWSLKNNFNVSLPAAYVAVKLDNYNEYANNMYCYSSCNMEYESVDTCKTQVFSSTSDAQQDAEIRAQCKFFVDGDFDRMEELKQKLLELARSLISNNTVIDLSVSSVTSEETVLETQERLVQETQSITQSVQIVETKAETQAVLVPELVEELVTVPKLVVEPVDVTEDVQTGFVEDGCKDPDYFWLCLFWLPLCVYLLYFPCKVRREIIKARVRARLANKRNQMQDSLADRRDRAQEVRDRLEAMRADAEAKKAQQERLEAQHASAAELAAKHAEEHETKEAAKDEIAKKVDEAEAKVAEQEANVGQVQEMLDARKAKKSSMPPQEDLDVPKEEEEEPTSPTSPTSPNSPKKAGLKKTKSNGKPKKKVFRWNIAANDQYIWAGGGGGAAPQNVQWGKHGRPKEVDRAKVINMRESRQSGVRFNPNALLRQTRVSRRSDVIEEETEQEEQEKRNTVVGKKLEKKSFIARASAFRRQSTRMTRRLSEQIRIQDELEFEKTKAMLELQALEDEIMAAQRAANMSAEAAQRALEEIERLKNEQEEEEARYQKELAKELNMEEDGELEDDGDFWLDMCACCCWVNTAEADKAHPGDIERGNDDLKSLADHRE